MYYRTFLIVLLSMLFMKIYGNGDPVINNFADEWFSPDTVEFIDGSSQFLHPEQPSFFMVVLRRIGTPIFLKYVSVYAYIRNYIRWIKAKVFEEQYYAIGNQHYVELKA